MALRPDARRGNPGTCIGQIAEIQCSSKSRRITQPLRALRLLRSGIAPAQGTLVYFGLNPDRFMHANISVAVTTPPNHIEIGSASWQTGFNRTKGVSAPTAPIQAAARKKGRRPSSTCRAKTNSMALPGTFVRQIFGCRHQGKTLSLCGEEGPPGDGGQKQR